MLSLTLFLSTGTRGQGLPRWVKEEIAKELIRYDSTKSELATLKENYKSLEQIVSVSNHQLAMKDSLLKESNFREAVLQSRSQKLENLAITYKRQRNYVIAGVAVGFVYIVLRSLKR